MHAHIRRGVYDDLAEILGLIKELAEYERAPNEVRITLSQLQQDGFGPRPLFEFLVAEVEAKIVGMVFFYYRYSTWKGKFLYLEDFVVRMDLRGKGIGSQLFRALMEVSQTEDCVGMTWQVLDWNEPALNFYRKYGARLDGEWTNGRLLRSEISRYINLE
jgi:GNAT superfamily N-acetyltransferase